MFHLLKSRTSIDIFRTEKCKVTFVLKYIIVYEHTFIRPDQVKSIFKLSCYAGFCFNHFDGCWFRSFRPY